MIVPQLVGLGFVDDPGLGGLFDLFAQVLGADQALALRLAQALFGGSEFLGEFQRLLQQPERVAGLQRRVGLLTQPVARLARSRDQVDDLVSDLIGRSRVRPAARENEDAQESCNPAVREVAQEGV